MIAIFFVIGLLLLHFFSVNEVALLWSQLGSFKFFLNMISHMFGHADIRHLLGNYLFVFPYAIYVEMRVGWKAFCKWWLFAGFTALAADIAVVCLGQPQMGVVGSSGAAFGITVAALWLVNENRYAMWICRAVVAYFIVTQTLNAYESFVNPFFSGVAYAAHLGGILGGIYLAQRQREHEARLTAAQDASK